MMWDVEGQAKIKFLSNSNKENSMRSIPPFTMKSWLNHEFTTDYVIDDVGQIVETITRVADEDRPSSDQILATMARESLDMTIIQGKAEGHLAIDTEKHKTQ